MDTLCYHELAYLPQRTRSWASYRMCVIPRPITPKEHNDFAHALELAVRYGSPARNAEEVTEHMIQWAKREYKNVQNINNIGSKVKELHVRLNVKTRPERPESK